MVKELRRETGKLVEQRSLNPHCKDGVLPLEDVDFVSRTV
jgi:phage repressor protein C with HTH and peptisase S24 domain